MSGIEGGRIDGIGGCGMGHYFGLGFGGCVGAGCIVMVWWVFGRRGWG